MGKLYLAGEMKKREWKDLLGSGLKRRLLSFYWHPEYTAHMADTSQAVEAGIDLFLDSGAFSAFTAQLSGKRVNLTIDSFAAYLNKYQHVYNIVSNLDHIGDTEEGAKKTYENQKALESLGCKVTPVYHVREDEKWLRRYIAEGYEYILIGGLVPESNAYCKERLDHLFSDILTGSDDRPVVKLHGFGLTAIELMKRYPWASVDSSSWMQKGMYGLCMMDTGKDFRAVVFSEDSKEARKADGWHWNHLNEQQRQVVLRWLHPVEGVTIEGLQNDYLQRNIVNVYTYQRMERLIPETFQHKSGGLFF